jgi:hypothetical protein
LKDNAADPPSGKRLADNIKAGKASATARRTDGRRQHPDRGRLSRPVRAEQSEHLTGRDLEGDVLHSLDATGIDLAQPFHFDHGSSSCHIDPSCFVSPMTDRNGRM